MTSSNVIRRFSSAVGGVLQCATQRPHLHTPLAPGINASASRPHFLFNAGLADIVVYVFLWEPRPQTVQILEGTILVAVGSIRLQLLAAQTLSLVSSVLHKPSSSESSGLLRSSTLSLAGRGENSVELLLRSSHEMERLLHVSTRSTSIGGSGLALGAAVGCTSDVRLATVIQQAGAPIFSLKFSLLDPHALRSTYVLCVLQFFELLHRQA